MENLIDLVVQKIGSNRKAGKLCGVSPQAVQRWRDNGRLPLTELTGKTGYALILARHARGVATVKQLRDLCKVGKAAAKIPKRSEQRFMA